MATWCPAESKTFARRVSMERRGNCEASARQAHRSSKRWHTHTHTKFKKIFCVSAPSHSTVGERFERIKCLRKRNGSGDEGKSGKSHIQVSTDRHLILFSPCFFFWESMSLNELPLVVGMDDNCDYICLAFELKCSTVGERERNKIRNFSPSSLQHTLNVTRHGNECV